jgi:hypothetical protein
MKRKKIPKTSDMPIPLNEHKNPDSKNKLS